MLANAAMTAMIQDFNVVWDDEHAVHAGLELLIKPAGTNIATKINKKPMSLSAAVHRAIDKHIENDNTGNNEQKKHKNATEKSLTTFINIWTSTSKQLAQTTTNSTGMEHDATLANVSPLHRTWNWRRHRRRRERNEADERTW